MVKFIHKGEYSAWHVTPGIVRSSDETLRKISGIGNSAEIISTTIAIPSK